MADKNYAKGVRVKTRETSFGDVLKLSIKVADFGPWVKEFKNEQGYVNLDIVPRKTPSEYGETHTVVLDTWKPDASKRNDEGGEKKPAKKKKDEESSGSSSGFEDDIPFA